MKYRIKMPRKQKRSTKKTGIFPQSANAFFQPVKQIMETGIHSPSQELPADIIGFFEPRLNIRLDNVRVHEGEEAGKAAEEINAKAFTHKNHIIFNKGEYDPNSMAGKKLIAHELVHIGQQKRSGPAFQRQPKQGKADSVTVIMIKASKKFWDDVHNFYTTVSGDIDKIVTGTSYDPKQTEPLKVVQQKKQYDIIIGPTYYNEKDDLQRRSMLYDSLVSKITSEDRFEQIADPEISPVLFNKIDPPFALGHYCSLNCPATVDALETYLQTGQISKAICEPMLESNSGYGFDISASTFSGVYKNWASAKKKIISQLKKHGDYVVIEAERSKLQQQKNNLAQWHYYTIVNIKGSLFVVDAFGQGEVTKDLDGYASNLAASTYRLVIGDFMIKRVRGNP
jgi:hypothetical protein